MNAKFGSFIHGQEEHNLRLEKILKKAPAGAKLLTTNINELERTLGVRSSSFMFVVFRLSDFKMRRKKCVYTFLYVEKLAER
ncbi:hypothetical protein ANME2D_00755 [Candidatus Methanoperedens nitroreducens]|uniref:Uncharacterized protein n=1 Tax=Candidatus Methanoperedens nitratireducens TaxID=1392998 RepID=A0A062V8Q8_9EURY|nr:hypothetical protein [Candidatus Methanoperedens nitroreducens]KCZ73682.1 hypothetical protein ANME2D_00755 [Candidatus Methanoperedens nitroreducens]MDJ1422359.1 hypothetical protein [Candidatus Methanoperedens sp.]